MITNEEVVDGFPLRKQIHPAYYRGVTIPTKDRSDWPAAKFHSFDESRAYRIRQWQEAGCSERMKAAWELVYDYWGGMKGMNPDELRLQRSGAFFRRRER